MNKFSISFAQADECNELAKVFEKVVRQIPYYNELAKDDEVKKFGSTELKSKIAEDPYSVIVAKEQTRIIGFCLSRFDDYTIWLEWFGVVSEYRGNGISDLLLTQLNETIVTRNCHKIWCDCRTTNKASLHILPKHGYQQLVTISNHWYGQDFILWEKPID